jgi:hypothetical protein
VSDKPQLQFSMCFRLTPATGRRSFGSATRSWRNPRLQPKSAFSRLLLVHTANLEGQQRVDLTRSPRGPCMTASCAFETFEGTVGNRPHRPRTLRADISEGERLSAHGITWTTPRRNSVSESFRTVRKNSVKTLLGPRGRQFTRASFCSERSS